VPQLTVRFDPDADAPLWAAIQAIAPGQRNAQVKRLLAAALGLDESGLAVRLAALEQRVAALEAGTRSAALPGPLEPAVPPPTPAAPPGWKASLAQLGVFEE
jgi:hypothetical protein